MNNIQPNQPAANFIDQSDFNTSTQLPMHIQQELTRWEKQERYNAGPGMNTRSEDSPLQQGIDAIKKSITEFIFPPPSSLPYRTHLRISAESDDADSQPWLPSIKSLPNFNALEFWNITYIEIVGLQDLEYLPDMSELKKLEFFIVNGCALKQIPIDIINNNLHTLQYFDVSDNELEGEIPSQLFNLTRIEQLDFSVNKLNHIDESVVQLQKNTKVTARVPLILNIKGNDFTDLPLSIFEMNRWEFNYLENYFSINHHDNKYYNQELVDALERHNKKSEKRQLDIVFS